MIGAMVHPYESFIHRVQKPGRYLGGEYRSIVKSWDDTPIRVALAFPDAYEIGMSHLGLKILYGALNRAPDILAERVFAPWIDMEAELRQRGLPLVSLENARPLAEFDCIGFSLQYELTFTNVLNMLDLAGLPIRSAGRTLDQPLIVAGGPVAMQPEPLAPFIDCFLIGDGEAHFPRFLRRYKELKGQGIERLDALAELTRLGGVYCPALYDTEIEPLTGVEVVKGPNRPGVPERVTRVIVEKIDDYPFPISSPVPSTEAVFDRYSMEISRGCTEGCRFCQAGMIYRPVRERSPEKVVETLLGAVKDSGYDEVSLTSLSTADYSSIAPLVTKLMDSLKKEKVALSVSSLRAYGLPDELLDAISGVRNTSLTFAPEAGTQRMRDVITKNISEEDMEKSAHGVFSRGWKRVKLYFMIGLPTEEEEDVRGIARTARRYLEIADHYHRGRGCEVTASVSSFVPKPHTPFQWAQMNDIAQIKAKQDILMDLTRGQRVRLKWHEPQISHVEAFMARGDRRMASLVEYAFRNGCRFDGWGEQLKFEVWMQGLDALGIDRQAYLRTMPVDARLPWDHIDVGITADFLRKEYRKALADRLSPPCGKPYRWRSYATTSAAAAAEKPKLVCYQCGIACDMTRMHEERIEHLVGIESLGPPEPAPLAPVPAAPVDLEGIRDRNSLPRTRIENETKLRYRLRFSKLGRQRFISHLDVVRLLPRIFRRAEVSLAYSRGFHPKPIMVFSPAMPLGWGSRGEYVDVVLAEDIDPVDLIDRLNRAAPEGVWFLAATRLGANDPALSRVIQAADYEIAIGDGADLEAARERAALIAAGGPLVIRRESDGGPREIDIAKAISSVEVVGTPGAEPGAEPAALRLRLHLNGGLTARPGEVFQWITGQACAPQDVVRIALWRIDGVGTASPMDLGSPAPAGGAAVASEIGTTQGCR
jgi:radical SAM family uncharacterized protein/radical SAM-linked protein